jgi:small nuclear ribonucleoprotein (snRNP)-like protein
MKILYNILHLFLLIFILLVNSLAQERDSLIQLYHGLGDTLDRFDRDYFGLLQNIDGFEYATFYIRNDKYLISKIAFTYYGILRDTTAIQNIGVLHSERLKIEQSLLENDKQDDTPREVIILTKNGKTYSGKLDMFSKDNLYLSSTKNLHTEASSKLNLLISVTKLEKITFESESNVLASVGWGALVGAALGGTMALASGDDELAQGLFLIAGAVFAVVGAGIGYFIGMSDSEDDVVIRIKNQIDLLKLKGYANYRLKYEKPYPQQYVEVE